MAAGGPQTEAQLGMAGGRSNGDAAGRGGAGAAVGGVFARGGGPARAGRGAMMFAKSGGSHRGPLSSRGTGLPIYGLKESTAHSFNILAMSYRRTLMSEELS